MQRKKLPDDTQRMWDLIRFCRSELHVEELITNEEYAELAFDHPAVARLETYDGMRSQRKKAIELLEAELAVAPASTTVGERVVVSFEDYSALKAGMKAAIDQLKS